MANPTTAQIQGVINAGGYVQVGNVLYGPGANTVAPAQGVIDAIFAAAAAVGNYPSFAQGRVGFADPNGLPTSDPNFFWDNAGKILNLFGALFTGTHGESAGFSWVEENIVLNTGGLTTNSAGNLLPANSLILAVVAQVSTTILTATSWGLSDPTTANRFAAATTNLTAGSSPLIGTAQWSGAVTTAAAGPTQASADKVRITATGSNPTAGAVRVGVLAFVFTAPTS